MLCEWCWDILTRWEECDEKQTVLDRSRSDFVLASGHRCQCRPQPEVESLDAECCSSCGSDSTWLGQLDRYKAHAQMGMDFGRYIYPRACLHAVSISICQDSIVSSRLRRELDTCSALPISTKHTMV